MSGLTTINLISLKIIPVVICISQVSSRINPNEDVFYAISRRGDVQNGIPKAAQSQQVSYVARNPYVAAGSRHGNKHGHNNQHYHGSPSHHGHGHGYGNLHGHDNGHGHGGHKKGYDSGFRKGHGYKGKKGFKDTTGHNKKAHGDYGKSNHKGYFDKGGKLFKGHKHKNKYYGDIHKGVTGKKGHHLGSKGHHNKGHKDKGFKNVYHKEEFHHNKKFYDDNDTKKYHNKYDDHDSFTKGHKGNDYEGGLYTGGFHNDIYGSKGENQEAKYHDNDVNHKDSYGHKKYYGDDHKHGHKKGHKEGHSSGHGHDHHHDHPHHHDHQSHDYHHDDVHHHDDHHHNDGHHHHEPHWLAHESEIHAQEHAHHDLDHLHQGAHSQNKPIETSKESVKPVAKYMPNKPAEFLPKPKPVPIKETIHYGIPSKEPPVYPNSYNHKLTNKPPSNVIKDPNSRFPPSTKSTSSYYSKSHYKPTKFTETHSDTKYLKPEHFSTNHKFETDLSKPQSSYSNAHSSKPILSNSKHPEIQRGFKPISNTHAHDSFSKPSYTNSKTPDSYPDNASSYSDSLPSVPIDPSLYSNNVHSEVNSPNIITLKKPRFKITKFSKSGKPPSFQKVPMLVGDKFKNSVYIAMPNNGQSNTKNDNGIVVTAGYNVNKRHSPTTLHENELTYLESKAAPYAQHSGEQQSKEMTSHYERDELFKNPSSSGMSSSMLASASKLSISDLKPKPYTGLVKREKLPNFESFGDFTKLPSLSR